MSSFKPYTELSITTNTYSVHLFSGLSNRLRALFSYVKISKKQKCKMLVYWPMTEACNGFFLHYFQPIPRIQFTTIQPTIVHYMQNKNHLFYPTPDYKLLKPLPNIQNIIDTFKEKLESPYIAVHIRRTDFINLCKNINQPLTQDKEFIDFIDKQPKEQKIYLATDNYKTQQKFIQLYGNSRLYINKPIKQNISTQRKTSLHDAIVDIYVCANAENFMGTHFSSFSTFINDLKSQNENEKPKI